MVFRNAFISRPYLILVFIDTCIVFTYAATGNMHFFKMSVYNQRVSKLSTIVSIWTRISYSLKNSQFKGDNWGSKSRLSHSQCQGRVSCWFSLIACLSCFVTDCWDLNKLTFFAMCIMFSVSKAQTGLCSTKHSFVKLFWECIIYLPLFSSSPRSVSWKFTSSHKQSTLLIKSSNLLLQWLLCTGLSLGI